MSIAYDGSRLTGKVDELRAEIGVTRANLGMISKAISDSQRALFGMDQEIEHLRADVHGQIEILQQIANVVTGQLFDIVRRGAEVTASIAAQQDKMAASIAAQQDKMAASIAAQQEQTAQEFKRVANRTQQLQIGLDALRADHQQVLEQNSIAQGLSQESQQSVTDLSTLTVTRINQLMQRAAIPLDQEILMRMPEGFVLVPAEDGALVAAIWESGGRLEAGTLKVVNAFLNEGDRFLDVGANIGLLTIPAARRVGQTGQVIAVEPASRLCDLLQRSIALNFQSDRFILHRCAAGDETGKAVLNLGLPVGHSSLLPLPGSVSSEEVDVRRLDDLVEPGLRIKLVKLDAEGFEPQVWRGMQRILAENPDIVVLIEFGPEHLRRAGLSIEAWLDMFLAPGFTPYEIDETEGFLKPLRPRANLASVFSLNLLLTKNPPSFYPKLEFA